MWQKIVSKELFILSFILLTIKNLIYQASFGDSIVFLGVSGLYGYFLFLESKKEQGINDRLKLELKDLKDSVSALTVKQSVKPQTNQRFF